MGLFPPSPCNIYEYIRPVQVYLDLTDLKEVKPGLIYEKVHQVILDEGHGPLFHIVFYCKENTVPKDLIREYDRHGLEIREICEVKKETILNLMLTSALVWTMHHYRPVPITVGGSISRLVLKPARVLLFSKNIEDSNLSIVRTRLGKLGCLVAFGHPETLFSCEEV